MLAIYDDVFSEDGVQRDVSSSILQLALADIHEEDLRHLRAKHDALILLALCAVYDGGCGTRTQYLIVCTTRLSSYTPGAYTWHIKGSCKSVTPASSIVADYAISGIVIRRAADAVAIVSICLSIDPCAVISNNYGAGAHASACKSSACAVSISCRGLIIPRSYDAGAGASCGKCYDPTTCTSEAAGGVEVVGGDAATAADDAGGGSGIHALYPDTRSLIRTPIHAYSVSPCRLSVDADAAPSIAIDGVGEGASGDDFKLVSSNDGATAAIGVPDVAGGVFGEGGITDCGGRGGGKLDKAVLGGEAQMGLGAQMGVPPGPIMRMVLTAPLGS